MWHLFNAKMSGFACRVDFLFCWTGKVRTQRPELRAESGKLLLTYRMVVDSEETASGSAPQ